MARFIKNFKLGKLVLPNNIFYAPMAGLSDLPYRQMALKFRPGLMFCEMVKVEALVRNVRATMQMLEFTEDMHPIGAQICGSKSKIAAEAAKIIEDKGFDLIDLNCGCPVPKITKDGSGAAMLLNLELIGDVLSSMVSSVKIPVTIKIRTGWDDSSYCADKVTLIAEKAGAKAIFIHGRTRKQGYSGSANLEYIRKSKEIAHEIKVIGNGDVFTGEAAFKMFEETKCDGILVARGTLGKPWLVEEIEKKVTKRSVKEALLEHFQYIVQVKAGDKKTFLNMKKVSFWYLRNYPGVKQLRLLLSKANSVNEIFYLVNHYVEE